MWDNAGLGYLYITPTISTDSINTLMNTNHNLGVVAATWNTILL